MSDRYANYYQSSGLYHVSLPLLMGTRLDSLLFGEDGPRLASLWNGIEAELRGLEKRLNRFDRSSEVAKVNTDAQFRPVEVSDVLWLILQDCRRYFELTEGCFDVTLSDFSKIIFLDETHSVQFGKYGLSLDFGGYAKGYALACVRKRLSDAGISRALVSFGNSSVLAVGAHPFGDSWAVGIDSPFDGSRLATVNLRDGSMSVSGNTPGNRRHIVDPRNAQFVAGRKMAAVVAENPIDAEALTTAWIASGEDTEPQWMKRFDLEETYLLK